jgi:hypothetical protein
MKIKPGDKVLITSDAFDPLPDGDVLGDDVFGLVATKGSLGVVVSLSEYEEYFLRMHAIELKEAPSRKPYFHSFLRDAKKGIDEGTAYPIKMEVVAPTESDVCEFELFLGVGKIQILELKFFKIIN